MRKRARVSPKKGCQSLKGRTSNANGLKDDLCVGTSISSLFNIYYPIFIAEKSW